MYRHPRISSCLLVLVPWTVPGGAPGAERTAAALDVEGALGIAVLPEGETESEIRTALLGRLPPLWAPGSPEELRRLQEALRTEILDEVVYRGWPQELRERPVEVRWKEVIERQGWGYRIRTLLYEPLPGLWIPALLYEPENLSANGKAPAVLHPNGHVGAPGKAVEYKQRRSIHLARSGMLVLNAEWYGMGELGGGGYAHNQAALLDLCGRSGLGLFHLALRGALDVLLSHPAADPARVCVSGLSGGGWQTILLSALDERVRISAPNAGYIGGEERIAHAGDVGDLEQNPPDLLVHGDYTHLTAMLPPRPALLIYNERDDCCFAAARARVSVYDPIRPLYHRFAPGAEFSFHANDFPGTHNYELQNRQVYYRFVNRHFLPPPARSDHERVAAEEVLSADELRVGLPEDNLTFQGIARSLAAGVPLVKAGALGESLAAREAARRKLREVLRLAPDSVAAEEARPEGSAWVRRLRLASGWTLPVVEIAPEGGAGPVTVLIADGPSRAAAAAEVRRRLARGERVLVADLLFSGECRSRARPEWQSVMLLRAAGRRPLGERVAQLLAVGRWARERWGRPVEVAASGTLSVLTALLAAALAEDVPSRAVALERPRSLEALIAEGAAYTAQPVLFTPGLLEVADLEELLVLAEGRAVLPGGPGR